jgi:RimJ/RimL family protein N-acetyltransferase
MMFMPVLETERLLIRPLILNDLDAIHQLLDVELRHVEFGDMGARTRQAREQWLQWTIVSYEQLAALNQPPYGDIAVVLKPAGPLIGVCGFVPCLEAFGQLPSFTAAPATPVAHLTSPEFGLYYAFFPAYQRQGYATEAVRTLVVFAFNILQVRRIVATTTYENVHSMSLMRRLGMRVEQNPCTDLPWPQVVGVLDNPAARVPDRP